MIKTLSICIGALLFSVASYGQEITLSPDQLEEVNKSETTPAYSSGIKSMYKFISDNFVQRINLSGTILTQFTVDTDGSLIDITVIKGLHKKLDNEAIRVIKSMPKWKPGIKDGVPTKATYTLPIKLYKQQED